MSELNLDNLTAEETEFKAGLSAAGIPVNEAGLKAEFETLTAAAGLNITNTSPYSPFWRAIQELVIKPVLWLLALLVKVVMPSMYAKTATGWWLEMIAWGYGIERKPATKAKGQLTFSRTDTAGALLIPAGTRVRGIALNGITYRMVTDADATIADGSASLQVAATAENEGAAYNLGAAYYVIADDIIPGITSVTNASDWLQTPGDDQESDDLLRLRIRNQFTAVSDWHTDAKYKAMISERTGFRIDHIFFDHNIPRGPGSADAYIVFDAGTTPTAVLDDMNDYISTQGNHGHGDDLQVKAMPETQHTLTLAVYAESTVQGADLTQLHADIESFIRCAFRENKAYDDKLTKVMPWSRFSLSRLGEEIHANFPKVLSLVWTEGDIVSQQAIPRLQTLTISAGA